MIYLATVLFGAFATAGALAATGETGASIRVASKPAGADVYVMGKLAGTTPMVISERDLYPISYDTNSEALYGMVLLRKSGCADYSRRLTRSDISDGLDAVLICAADTAAPALQAETEMHQPSVPEQRLQQLKVLRQLHDEGLISDEEEENLRERILDTL